MLYGMISAIGVRNVVENKVDFTKSRNLIIAAVILTALPEVLRGLNDYRMLIYAIVLILLMLANNNEKLNAYKEKISITNLFKNKKAGNTLDKEANS